MAIENLQLLWFILLCVLLGGYAILDGFDWGVGILHPLARGDHERRVFLNAIGPIWDGNEVWLVTFGGAMFAAFPEAYATIFSGFYNAFMLLLFALIFRAVSIEFRSKITSAGWRRFWDASFFVASLLAALLFGVAVGNAIVGIPLDSRGIYAGSFFDLLGLYPLLVGAMTVALFAMHGAIYLHLKTEPPLQDRVRGWMWHSFGVFLVLYLLTTIVTLIRVPRATENLEHMPWLWGVVLLSVLAIGNIPRAVFAHRPGQAFASSCLTIACLVTLFAAALFPNMVANSAADGISLTIHNASASARTLTLMAIIALIGMPLVLAYTAVVYWTFRGKVVIDRHSY